MMFGDIKQVAHDLILWLLSSNYHSQMHQFSAYRICLSLETDCLVYTLGCPFLESSKETQTIFASTNPPHLDAQGIIPPSLEKMLRALCCQPRVTHSGGPMIDRGVRRGEN